MGFRCSGRRRGGRTGNSAVVALRPKWRRAAHCMEVSYFITRWRAVDESGTESPLSFIVRAVVERREQCRIERAEFFQGTDGLQCLPRRHTGAVVPDRFEQEVATEFAERAIKELVAPPDSNFDHANFYWRMELQTECGYRPRTASIGNDSLRMTENRYRGMIVRITSGRGAGQERQILANTETELTVSPGWTVLPDTSSLFVVAETGWQFGDIGKEQPGSIQVFEPGGRDGTSVRTLGQYKRSGVLRRAVHCHAVADRRQWHDATWMFRRCPSSDWARGSGAELWS